ncbi:Cellulose synthase catalytic subunit [UDP-forming] [Lachnellula suecica]|uniref:Cellulose synthase catalytic subunit [UDP-forming] n=1 Tax=Lachnellula suecica TaxID=602035 RepID=A0A8T9CCB6_9HELO|nr:Cellulose synthase catalytic subunit [UDP-forming] [Lachnellula suecica]
MITFPAKARQTRPNDSSYPTFSGQSSATSSPYTSQSASSSRVLLLDNFNDSRPQTPRPSFLHSPARSSFSSDSGSIDEKEHNRNFENVPIYKAAHNNSFANFIPPETFTIETVDKNDDVDLLSPWRRRLYRLSPLFTFLAVGAYFLYYAYRIHCTIGAQQAYHKTYVMAWLFISAEGCVACPALLHQLYQMLSIRGRSRPKLRIRGDDVPTVDVFITCCGEDVDIVLDTARAACVVDYPQDRFRVVVLDDGKDAELEKAIDDLNAQFPNLYYHARIKIKGKPHHFKAGNLTGGTDFVTTLEGGPGEFMAPLDADMIPEPDWLRAIIAHMVNDPKMALVCPPQLFYNVPKNDPLCQSLDTFVHVMEPTKDANGVAWCTGSGYAIRRSALESIGGWPVGSLAEDTYTSSLLLGSGWITAFCHEALQFGTVPDTITGHLKQRTRWTLGTLQTALKLKFCLFGDVVKGMSFFARLSAFVFAIDAFFKIFLLVALLTIPIVLISGGQLVAYSNNNQLRWQIRLCFASLMLTRLNEWITYLPSGYRLAQRDTGAQMWMAPFHAMTIIRSFILPSWLGGKAMAFSSSGSIKSDINERDPKTRASLFRRLKVVLWDCDVYLHLLYILFALTAVTLSTVEGIVKTDGIHTLLIYLLTHAFWPPMLWLLTVSACCEPIRYAIWPPTMPEREEMLDRDPKTGIARPKESWKKTRYSKKTFWHETQYSGVTIYTTVVFVGAFFV